MPDQKAATPEEPRASARGKGDNPRISTKKELAVCDELRMEKSTKGDEEDDHGSEAAENAADTNAKVASYFSRCWDVPRISHAFLLRCLGHRRLRYSSKRGNSCKT